MMNTLFDLRHAFRSLRRTPGVVGLVIATLALGIGGTTAMFGLMSRVVVEPLPFAAPDELVMIWEQRPLQGRDRNPVSPADFFDWRDRARVFDTVAAFGYAGVSLTGEGDPVELRTARVTDGFFELLGVPLPLGRTFSKEEQTAGADRVAVIGHGLWRRRFGSDPEIVGRRIHLDGIERVVVGIAPEGFDFPDERELWIPLALEPGERMRGMHYLHVLARIARERTLDEAASEMKAVAAQLEEEFPEANTGHRVRVVALEDELLGGIRPLVWMLFAVSVVVLLIGCTNAANLWLARSASRDRELAVAAALGAGRLRLIRQHLLESVLVASASGAVGSAVALLVSKPILDAIAPGAGPPTSFEVLAFASIAAGVAWILFSAPGTLRVASTTLTRIPRDTRHPGGGNEILKKSLVVVEVALALLLMIAAMLLVKSFHRLESVNAGFRARGVLAFQLSLAESRYPERHQRNAFFDEITNRLRALPGVQSIGRTTILPLSGGDAGRFFSIEGGAPSRPGESPSARVRDVSPGYFRTMNIPLVRGRDFSSRDDASAPPVVVVNQRLAAEYFPNEDPIGKRVQFNPSMHSIIGVVGDVRHTGLDADVNPHAYFASAQRAPRYSTVVVRTTGDPLELVSSVREVVWSVDANQPITGMERVEDVRTRSIGGPRKLRNFLLLFAIVALVLAAGGIYGVISYLVAQRSRELAIRMALGAQVRDVVSLVMSDGAKLVAAGGAAAFGAGFLAAPSLSPFLFDVAPIDLETWSVSALTVAAAGVLATAVPAGRTARVDPLVSLRRD